MNRYPTIPTRNVLAIQSWDWISVRALYSEHRISSQWM